MAELDTMSYENSINGLREIGDNLHNINVNLLEISIDMPIEGMRSEDRSVIQSLCDRISKKVETTTERLNIINECNTKNHNAEEVD